MLAVSWDRAGVGSWKVPGSKFDLAGWKLGIAAGEQEREIDKDDC